MRLAVRVVLIAALVAVLYWPAAATIALALRAPSPDRVDVSGFSAFADSGGVARPLALARTTSALVGLTELLALPLGIALAWLLARTDLWGRRALFGLLLVVIFVPLPLHAIAWIGAFGNLGRSQLLGAAPMVVGLPGAAFVHAISVIPAIVLLVAVGLRAVEPELEESALLDHPRRRVAILVTLRRSLGAIAGAALAVTILTAGEMTVTDLLQVRTFAEEAYILCQQHFETAVVSCIVVAPLLVVLAPLLLFAGWTLLWIDPPRTPSSHARPKVWTLGRGRLLVSVFVWALVGAAVAIPVYGLIWRAGRSGRPLVWSFGALTSTLATAWDEMALKLGESCVWAAVAASLSVALAWCLAWLSRDSVAWRWLTLISLTLALAVPGPVAGMALGVSYARVAWVYDNPAIVVLAYTLRTLPFALLIVWTAVHRLPRELLESAAVEGYAPWGVVRRVGLPMTRGAIATAWGAAFLLSIGELAAVNRVQVPGHEPLAVHLWAMMHFGVESKLAGAGLILVILVGVASLAPSLALGRLVGAWDAE